MKMLKRTFTILFLIIASIFLFYGFIVLSMFPAPVVFLCPVFFCLAILFIYFALKLWGKPYTKVIGWFLICFSIPWLLLFTIVYLGGISIQLNWDSEILKSMYVTWVTAPILLIIGLWLTFLRPNQQLKLTK
jgi:hypothetical protein